MNAPASRRRWWLALGGVVSAVAGVALAPDPEPVRSLIELHDYGHVFVFGVVALLLGRALRVEAARPLIETAAGLAWAFLGTQVVGLVVELLQAAGGGFVDPGDLARNCGGGVAGLLLARAGFGEWRTRSRWLLRAGALLLLGALLWPTWAAWQEERQARAQFPVLADFSSPRQLSRFEWEGGAAGRWGRDQRGPFLEATLPPGDYPGLTLAYFPRDWQGYLALVIEVENPQPQPLLLNLRMDDRKVRLKYADRFNSVRLLAPGPNRIEIPLALVESAPVRRKFDLGNVRYLCLFLSAPSVSEKLILRSIRLEGAGTALAANWSH